jgi:hypothetical protein
MKNSILKLLLCLFVTIISFNFIKAQEPELKDTTDSKYKVGQKWSYKTRPNEKDSYFIVLKVENYPKFGNIIHIALSNLKVKNPGSPNGITDQIIELPFAERFIDESAVKILKEKVALPNYQARYDFWRKNVEAKKGGVHTSSIAKFIDVMEASMKANRHMISKDPTKLISF